MASTATATSTMDPQPRVELDIDDTTVGASVTITIWQLSSLGQVAVRGAEGIVISGGFVVTDYELPPNEDVTYRIEGFNGSGVSLGFVLTLGPVSVTIAETWAVVSDPLATGNAVLVRTGITFASKLTRNRDLQRYVSGGRTVALAGPYRLLEQVPLRLIVEAAQVADLAAVIDQGLILVRSAATGLPGAFFAVLPSVPRVLYPEQSAGEWSRTEVWDLVADEVSRPELGVIEAYYSYDFYEAYLDGGVPGSGTYTEAAATWSTYIYAQRNPPPEA